LTGHDALDDYSWIGHWTKESILLTLNKKIGIMHRLQNLIMGLPIFIMVIQLANKLFGEDIVQGCTPETCSTLFFSLVLTSHSQDFSLSVQDIILDNLGSLHCCHSYVIVDKMVG